MKKLFSVVTLGCRTNQYESQAYSDQLKALGYEQADQGASVCIVNTCTVTESADQSSKKAIRDLKKAHPEAKIVVTGCLAERAPDSLKAIDASLIVVSNKDKESLLKSVIIDTELPEFQIRQFEGRTRAFVKVQDGCNSFCTYCIIPYVRGRSRSRPLSEIIHEIEGLVQNGYKEVVLTGINIGDWDGGRNQRLHELVSACDAIVGLERLRLSSIDADEVDQPLIDAILGGKRTCHSLHMVLQSGSNAVLKRMNRKYSRNRFLATADELLKQCPDFCFTTDIIVGFPGETEADFEETLAVVREIGFLKVHFFPFSPRERTRAFLFTDRIPDPVIKERKARLAVEAEKAAFYRREHFVGKTVDVLSEDGNFGHTIHFLPVYIPECPPNQIKKVHLTENNPSGLKGIWA